MRPSGDLKLSREHGLREQKPLLWRSCSQQYLKSVTHYKVTSESKGENEDRTGRAER